MMSGLYLANSASLGSDDRLVTHRVWRSLSTAALTKCESDGSRTNAAPNYRPREILTDCAFISNPNLRKAIILASVSS